MENSKKIQIKEFTNNIITPCCIYQTYKGSIANLTPDN